MSNIYLDSFDYVLNGPIKPAKTVAEKEIEILKASKRVSIFWITETQARAKRITKLIKSGRLSLDNSIGFPWSTVNFKG